MHDLQNNKQGEFANLDQKNNLDCTDILTDICIKLNENSEIDLGFIEEQIVDIFRLGQCSQGRTTRFLQIWNAIKSGAVLENVVVNKDTLKPDFDDGSLTENTRAAYPLDYIPGAVIPSVGGHPKVIIFLTADALGLDRSSNKYDITQNRKIFSNQLDSKLD